MQVAVTVAKLDQTFVQLGFRDPPPKHAAEKTHSILLRGANSVWETLEPEGAVGRDTSGRQNLIRGSGVGRPQMKGGDNGTVTRTTRRGE